MTDLRTRMRRVGAAALAALAVVGGSVTAAVTTASLTAQPAGAAGAVVTGTGSSYAAVAINQWVGQVEQLYGYNINYATQSSVIGLNYFAQGQVNFAASEIGYSTGQANNDPPTGEAYQYMPDVAGAICLMYNLVDQTQAPITNLHINPQVLFGIFAGTIRNWDDSQIAALNPGVLLPNQAIVPVYRTDASGDNYILSDYFYTLMQGTWNGFETTVGAPTGPTAIWPTPQSGGDVIGPYNFINFIGQNGSDNASNYVNGNTGSMTYVETAYAIEHHRPCAELENNSGNFLAPSTVGDALALQSDQLAADLEQNLTGVFETSNANAYPISAYSYIITQEGEMPAAIGAVMGPFIKFAACRGQQTAEPLGYAPIPPNLVQDDFDAIRRMNGAPDPGALTAANCPNPYLVNPSQLPGYNPNPAAGSGGGVTQGGGNTPGPAANNPNPAAGSGGGVTQGGGNTTGLAGSNTGHTGDRKTAIGRSDAVGHLPPKVNAGSGSNAQARGLALLAATNKLAGLSAPTSTAVGWTLFFLLLVAAVPIAASVRRRRRRSRGGVT